MRQCADSDDAIVRLVKAELARMVDATSHEAEREEPACPAPAEGRDRILARAILRHLYAEWREEGRA